MADETETELTREERRARALEELWGWEEEFSLLIGGTLVPQGEPDPSKGSTRSELWVVLRYKIEEARRNLGLPPLDWAHRTTDDKARVVSVVVERHDNALVFQGPCSLLDVVDRELRGWAALYEDEDAQWQLEARVNVQWSDGAVRSLTWHPVDETLFEALAKDKHELAFFTRALGDFSQRHQTTSERAAQIAAIAT